MDGNFSWVCSLGSSSEKVPTWHTIPHQKVGSLEYNELQRDSLLTRSHEPLALARKHCYAILEQTPEAAAPGRVGGWNDWSPTEADQHRTPHSCTGSFTYRFHIYQVASTGRMLRAKKSEQSWTTHIQSVVSIHSPRESTQEWSQAWCEIVSWWRATSGFRFSSILPEQTLEFTTMYDLRREILLRIKSGCEC